MRSPAASASPTPGASRRPTDAVSARDRRRRPNAARVNWGCGSIVAVPGQRASDRDVFIQRLPVQASAAEAACFPRFAGGTQKTREPGDGNPQRPPVRKLDPHVVLVEPDTHCPSRRIHSHAFSMRSRFASIYPGRVLRNTTTITPTTPDRCNVVRETARYVRSGRSVLRLTQTCRRTLTAIPLLFGC